MTPVRLEPAALRSRVKHSTTEPLRSHKVVLDGSMLVLDDIMFQVPDEIKSYVVNVQCVWKP